MHLAHVIIAGRSLNATPETVFLGVVMVSIGLRTWLQRSIWWYHVADRVLDVLIGAVAISTVPQFGAYVSNITTKPWAGYGVSVILAVATGFLVFGKKRK